MASGTRRVRRSKNYYKDLNNNSTAAFFQTTPRRRKNLYGGRLFEVERLVTERKRKKEGLEYLVMWKGCSPYESSWEPQQNITSDCIKYFNKPTPSERILFTEVTRLRVNIETSLKSIRRGAITLDFRSDVFNYLFGGRGEVSRRWILLHANDFKSKYFPSGWDELFDEHGQGLKLYYPVKMRHFLSWSPKKFSVRNGNVSKANRACLEKLSFDIIKVAGGVQ